MTSPWPKRKSLKQKISSFVVILLNLCVILSIFLISKNLNLWLSNWANSDELSIFVAPDMTASEQAALEKTLSEKFTKEEVTTYTQEETIQLIQKELTTLQGTEFSKEFIQSFPALYLVQKRPANKVSLEEVSKYVRTLPGVEEANFGLGWLDKISPFIQTLRGLGLFFCVLLLVGITFVIKSVLTQRILSLRDEVQIQEFLGATAQQIRAPLILDATLNQAAALLIALFLTWGMSSALEFYILKASAVSHLGISKIYFFSWVEILIFFVGLSVFSTFFSWRSLQSIQTEVR